MNIFKARAFVTPQNLGGNPAGVVLEKSPNTLSDAERQSLATRLGFSETAFYSENSGEARLRFFTPKKPIDFCGHATVATYGVLSSFLRAGEYLVDMAGQKQKVRIEEDRIGMQQKKISHEFVNDRTLRESLARSLNLRSEKLMSVGVIENGVKYAVIEMDMFFRQFHNIQPDMDAISRLSEQNGLIGYYLYRKGSVPSRVYARMFAPFYGIPEESATGMGASALMIHLNAKEDQKELHVIQGMAMSPSQESHIHVKMDDDSTWIFGRYSVDQTLSL